VSEGIRYDVAPGRKIIAALDTSLSMLYRVAPRVHREKLKLAILAATNAPSGPTRIFRSPNTRARPAKGTCQKVASRAGGDAAAGVSVECRSHPQGRQPRRPMPGRLGRVDGFDQDEILWSGKATNRGLLSDHQGGQQGALIMTNAFRCQLRVLRRARTQQIYLGLRVRPTGEWTSECSQDARR